MVSNMANGQFKHFQGRLGFLEDFSNSFNIICALINIPLMCVNKV